MPSGARYRCLSAFPQCRATQLSFFLANACRAGTATPVIADMTLRMTPPMAIRCGRRILALRPHKKLTNVPGAVANLPVRLHLRDQLNVVAHFGPKPGALAGIAQTTKPFRQR